MRGIFAIFVFLNSAIAISCPNLAGTYVCSADDSEKVIWSQEAIDGVTIFTLKQNKQKTQFPADDHEYTFEAPDSHAKGSARFTCIGDEFRYYLKGEQNDPTRDLVVSWNLMQSMSLDENRNLVSAAKGEVIENGRPHVVDTTSTCERLK